MIVKHHSVLADRERQLIHDLYPSLRRFAAVVGPVEVEPDDLVQEAFVRAMRRGPLTDLTFPTAYLKRCIVNLSKDQVRGFVRRRRALVALAATSEAFMEAYPSDVIELMDLPTADKSSPVHAGDRRQDVRRDRRDRRLYGKGGPQLRQPRSKAAAEDPL